MQQWIASVVRAVPGRQFCKQHDWRPGESIAVWFVRSFANRNRDKMHIVLIANNDHKFAREQCTLATELGNDTALVTLVDRQNFLRSTKFSVEMFAGSPSDYSGKWLSIAYDAVSFLCDFTNRKRKEMTNVGNNQIGSNIK